MPDSTPLASLRAIAAVIEIARQGDRGLKCHECEERLEFPARSLEAALQRLRRKGILGSAVGRSGGYKLLRTDVSLRDITIALQPTREVISVTLPIQVRSALKKANDAYLVSLDALKIETLLPIRRRALNP